jgi:hypothetical protein
MRAQEFEHKRGIDKYFKVKALEKDFKRIRQKYLRQQSFNPHITMFSLNVTPLVFCIGFLLGICLNISLGLF